MESTLTSGSAKPKPRCAWPGLDERMVRYHDEEWGLPVHDDHVLFEFLILEGAQAGLSWSTVLAKRDNYRAAMDGFDPERVARYRDTDVARLLDNPGIIRNRLKIYAAINNAQQFLKVQEEFATFDSYIWKFVDGEPLDNRVRTLADIPATSDESDAMSADLKRRGFKFVGSTICYAFMQAVGIVNDHQVDCFRYSELGGSG